MKINVYPLSIDMQSGYLLINKPEDWTSHDVVAYIRGIARAYHKAHELPGKAKNIRVGHAGTLDPFATGLLIIGVGREATKHIDQFKNQSKTYTTTIHLGATSDTYDKTGNITQGTNKSDLPKSKITNTLQHFIGQQQQIPPMYSAKKVGGKKLYELARKGIEVKRKPCDITIHDISLISYEYPHVTIQVSCSTGTYIRSLAHDIGQTLGTGAYCETLQRDNIGNYSTKNAVNPKHITIENITDLLFE